MTISIITATYNSAATITDTLRSIAAQSHQDFEVIVVDGASTDDTLARVEQFRPQLGDRLRVVSEPDRGLYDAMNKGIAMAQGEIVGILNSDDFYSSAAVLAQVAQCFALHPVQAIYGDIHYVAPSDLQRPVRYYSSRMFRPWMMRLGFMPAHPSFYCRREVYQQHGTFELSYKVAADFECLLRLLYVQRISTHYLPIDFVTMRTGGVSNAGLRSHLNIMRDHLRALHTHGIRSNVMLMALRYVYKVGEILYTRLRNPLRRNSTP
ncbi:MAG: glycosyltransferase [Bacteroidaceae bacterium]|nr:glycosyltransferase [Bacteroidaceae bacterium]